VRQTACVDEAHVAMLGEALSQLDHPLPADLYPSFAAAVVKDATTPNTYHPSSTSPTGRRRRRPY
jgi:hypothetical protein